VASRATLPLTKVGKARRIRVVEIWPDLFPLASSNLINKERRKAKMSKNGSILAGSGGTKNLLSSFRAANY